MPRKGEEEGWAVKGAKRKKGRVKTGQLLFGPFALECTRNSLGGPSQLASESFVKQAERLFDKYLRSTESHISSPPTTERSFKGCGGAEELRSRPPFTEVGPGSESALRSAFQVILGTCLGVPQRVLFECFLALWGLKNAKKHSKSTLCGTPRQVPKITRKALCSALSSPGP